MLKISALLTGFGGAIIAMGTTLEFWSILAYLGSDGFGYSKLLQSESALTEVYGYSLMSSTSMSW